MVVEHDGDEWREVRGPFRPGEAFTPESDAPLILTYADDLGEDVEVAELSGRMRISDRCEALLPPSVDVYGLREGELRPVSGPVPPIALGVDVVCGQELPCHATACACGPGLSAPIPVRFLREAADQADCGADPVLRGIDNENYLLDLEDGSAGITEQNAALASLSAPCLGAARFSAEARGDGTYVVRRAEGGRTTDLAEVVGEPMAALARCNQIPELALVTIASHDTNLRLYRLDPEGEGPARPEPVTVPATLHALPFVDDVRTRLVLGHLEPDDLYVLDLYSVERVENEIASIEERLLVITPYETVRTSLELRDGSTTTVVRPFAAGGAFVRSESGAQLWTSEGPTPIELCTAQRGGLQDVAPLPDDRLLYLTTQGWIGMDRRGAECLRTDHLVDLPRPAQRLFTFRGGAVAMNLLTPWLELPVHTWIDTTGLIPAVLEPE